MNKIYFIPILFLICRIAIGQGIPTYPTLGTQSISATSGRNYIKTITYKDATPSLSDASEANVDITYFDGLGRPIQQNAALASPTGLDVITRLEYDDFGRQTKNYLPYTKSGASNGGYISNITSITDQRAFISGLYGIR